jgi:hypothetical protein
MTADWKSRAKAQFADRRTTESLVPIPVPEWSTTVYYWPEMTLGERRDIFLHARQDGESTVMDLEAIAVTLMVRARDASGRRLFARAERLELMNEYDANVMAQIVSAMASPEPNTEDAEKK